MTDPATVLVQEIRKRALLEAAEHCLNSSVLLPIAPHITRSEHGIRVAIKLAAELRAIAEGADCQAVKIAGLDKIKARENGEGGAG